MTVKFTNNASTTVATGINSSATSLTVASASAFPQLAGADDYCYLTIQQSTGTVREVVKATALSSNTFTIVRAQDNTSAGTWSVGDIVELRMTAALLTDVIDAATVEGVKTNFQYTPTAGQTVFSGADNSSNTMIINQAALVSVYMNGVRLVQGTDYNVSSANNTVTLTVGATTADIIDIEVFGNFTGQSGAAVAITGGAISGTSVAATTLSASGTATLNTFVSNNVTISGGTIESTNIGATTAGTGRFSALTSTGDASFTGSSSGSTVLTLTSGALADTPLMVFQRTGGAVAGKLAYEDGNTAISFGTTTAHELKLLTNNTNRLEINSSGNATFAGTISSGAITTTGDVEVRSGNKLILQRPNNGIASNISTDSTGAMILDSLNGEGFFFNNAGTNAFKLDPVNATFAGSITSQGINSTSGTVQFTDGGSAFDSSDSTGHARFTQTNGSAQIGLFRSGSAAGGSYIGADSSKLLRVYNSSFNSKFDIDTSGNATFSGSVGIGTTPASSVFEVQDANGVSIKFGDLAAYPNNVVPCFIGTGTSALAGTNGDLVLVPRTSDGGKLIFATGDAGAASENMRIANTGIVINENGADRDFRVESNGSTHMLFVDGGNNRVGINDTSPDYKLDVLAGNGDQFRINNGGDRFTQMYFAHNNVAKGAIWVDATDSSFAFYAYSSMDANFYSNAQKKFSLRGSEVVVNEDSHDVDFRVESDGNTHMLFVDAGNNHVNIGTSSDFGGVLNVAGGAVFDDATSFDPDTLPNGRIAIGDINDGGGFSAPGIGWGGAAAGQNAAIVSTAGRIFMGVGNGTSASDIHTAMELRFSEVVVNQDGVSMDFRVESDNNQNMFLIDASNDEVVIGKSSGSTSTAGLGMDVGSSIGQIRIVKTNSGTHNAIRFYHSGSNVGNIQYSDSATSYLTSSDQRLKDNIQDAADAGELIDAIQVRSFDWKADGEHQRYGMVAQELNTVAPEAVSIPEDPDEMMGVDYSKLVPMLIKEIQTLRSRVAELENN